MMPKRPRRAALVALLLGASAACSCDDPSDPPPVPPIPPGVPFTLSGTVTYDFVPATYDPAAQAPPYGTLEFARASPRPVRNARVQVRQLSTVLGEATTDGAGGYAITFTPGPSGSILVAALAETVTPSIRVEDNTDGDAVWAVGATMVDASPTLDVHATHGWGGTAYVAADRIAAPFAILDAMYTAATRFLEIRAVAFPPLEVNWSPENFPSATFSPATGAILTSHYSGGSGEIYVLGKEGVDADEFDSHVIVHEWGHYFEDTLSRSDSPGLFHDGGDVLDPRLAFGEGYGNALASMLLPEPVYADTFWDASGIIDAFGFDAESEPNPSDDFADEPWAGTNPGPFSEMSVLRVLYDLYDDSGAQEAWDGVALGLGPIHDTLVGPEKDTDALTTIASFVAGLKAQPGIAGTPTLAAIDALLAERGIGPIADEWGTGDAGLTGMFPAAAPLPFSGDATLYVGYASNTWQSVQYWVVAGTGRELIVSTSSTRNVGLEAFRRGVRVAAANAFPFSGNQTETMRFASVNGATYVIVLTGYTERDAAAGSPEPYGASLSVTSP